MLLAKFSNQCLGVGCALQQAREQEIIFLGVMEAIQKTVDISEEAMKNGKFRMLAAVDFGDQLFQAVKHCSEILMFTFDNGNGTHVLPVVREGRRLILMAVQAYPLIFIMFLH